MLYELSVEINKVIELHARKEKLTLAGAVGTLELVKHNLIMSANDPDKWE